MAELTQEDIRMLASALSTHIGMLFRDADAYKKNGNTEAVKDCIEEVRKFQLLNIRLKLLLQ